MKLYYSIVTRWAAPLKLDISGCGKVAAFMSRIAAGPAVQQAERAEQMR